MSKGLLLAFSSDWDRYDWDEYVRKRKEKHSVFTPEGNGLSQFFEEWGWRHRGLFEHLPEIHAHCALLEVAMYLQVDAALGDRWQV